MATTITNLALSTKAGYDPSKPVFQDVIELDLKSDYDVAGLLNFTTAVRAAIGSGKTVFAVLDVNCKGLVPEYNATADTLFLRWVDTTVDGAPLTLVPTGNMAAYTDLRLLVLSQ